jgi:hypothetical protein
VSLTKTNKRKICFYYPDHGAHQIGFFYGVVVVVVVSHHPPLTTTKVASLLC